MSKKFVRQNEVMDLIKSVKNGNTFGLSYKRVNPKCNNCNTSNKAWKGLTHCPICNESLEYDNHTEVLVVSENCFNDYLFEYFDNNKKGIRRCLIRNIFQMKIEDNEYFVINI